MMYILWKELKESELMRLSREMLNLHAYYIKASADSKEYVQLLAYQKSHQRCLE